MSHNDATFIEIEPLRGEDALMHYGVGKLDGSPGRGSGRYPLGSGEKPHQHSGDFISRVEDLRRKGMSDTDIARSLNLSTTQFRVQIAIANEERRSVNVATARRLRDEGNSLNEIARKMGYKNDSSVRTLLDENAESRMNQSKKTAEYLKQIVDEKGMLDVGAGQERFAGVSRVKFDEALYRLQLEGYPVYGGSVEQVTNPGKRTVLKVLCPPGTEHKDIYSLDIHSIEESDKILTDNGNKIEPAFKYPESLDSKRLAIRYADDPEGGAQKDGVIELRRGCKDLDLGESNYAQVRIMVDGKKYLKGMAVYADDMPDGIDVIFNTNKKAGTPMEKVLKDIKPDRENPFGSLIKERGGQYYYEDEHGNKKLGLINKRAEEGDWADYSDKLPSQFLSKQPMKLINQQLNLTMADRKAEFDDIMGLTNKTVKRELLRSFAEDCDSAAVHLQAAALPRQKYQVILPLMSVKDNEVFAPNYKNGEKVALVRYPHGGTFEIPIVTVNNKNAEGKRVIGTGAKDAIGINAKVASRLSGADFDGDTVMVIPIGAKSQVKSTPPLKGLEGFDPTAEYGPDSPGSAGKNYKRMSEGYKQQQMGVVSNLITDMTLRGANDAEIARAVRHSMVVIDAVKHDLDYKRSEKENGIAELKRSYQRRIDPETGKELGGASTLISRAKSPVYVNKRRGNPIINKEDGTLTYKEADPQPFKNKDGSIVYKKRQEKSTQMAEAKDAMELSSGTKQENAYANYANYMKSLANLARKEMLATGRSKFSASAKEVYRKEVDDLMAQYNEAQKNRPRERQAQLLASNKVKAIQQSNPDLDKEELKKVKNTALKEARAQVGAKRVPIKVTDKSWEAIQNGAISDSTLASMLKYMDSDDLRKRATPRATKELSSSKQSLIKTMKASGYTNEEIADRLGVSTSTINKYK